MYTFLFSKHKIFDNFIYSIHLIRLFQKLFKYDSLCPVKTCPYMYITVERLNIQFPAHDVSENSGTNIYIYIYVYQYETCSGDSVIYFVFKKIEKTGNFFKFQHNLIK